MERLRHLRHLRFGWANACATGYVIQRPIGTPNPRAGGPHH